MGILWPGDLSYADGLQVEWDYWGRMVANISERLPMMFAAGNHEDEQQVVNNTLEETGFTENGQNGGDLFNAIRRHQAINARFRMPNEESGAKAGNSYYSYNAGPVHVINLNTYVTPGEVYDQVEWFHEDVAKLNRHDTPWLIVLIHAPWYNSNVYHQNVYEPHYWTQTLFEQAFLDNGVDLVLNGHVHSYERVWPTNKGKVDNETGIPYIVTGAGGNNEGPSRPFVPFPREWSAFRLNKFGYGVLDIHDAYSFTWNYYCTADNDINKPCDTYTYSTTDYKRGLYKAA